MTLYSLRLPRRLMHRRAIHRLAVHRTVHQMVHRAVLSMLCAALILAHSTMTYAQHEIIRNPDAKRFRLLWSVEGTNAPNGKTDGGIGSGLGQLGDVYGTGTAWAVYSGHEGLWRIYAGYTGDRARDTIPIQKFSAKSDGYPIVGSFWGPNDKAIGFFSDLHVSGLRTYSLEIRFHRVVSNRIDTAAAAVLNTRAMTPPVANRSFSHIPVMDLDEDGADELIIPWGTSGRSGGPGGEFWIFKGGKNFSLDTPTVVIPTPLKGGKFALQGDFDGDGHIDLVTSISHTDTLCTTLIFYYGDGTLEGFGKPENRRIVTLGAGYPRAHFGIAVLDCDGDSSADIVMNTGYGPDEGIYIYRSGTGKDARTRSYTTSDADNVLPYRAWYGTGGALNDPTRRFDMLLLFDGSATMKALSGGIDGPDGAYDAEYPFDPYAIPLSIPDIDGDGWDDLLVGSPYSNSNAGYACILAGGPEIPRDFIHTISNEHHKATINIWPNPAHDGFHIAVRDNLHTRPSRFVVHDLLGREIACGEFEPGKTTTFWRCDLVASGMYGISIYTEGNRIIGTTHAVK